MILDAVVVKDVKKTYKTRKKETEALKGVSFEVKKGEIFGLLGPNGAGKTTLIKICATLLGKTAGEVEILGMDISAYKISNRKDQIYRNCVHPELGLHIFNTALDRIKAEDVEQTNLFQEATKWKN